MDMKFNLIMIMLSILFGALGSVITQSYNLSWVAICFGIIFGAGCNEFMNFLKYWEEVGSKK